MARIVQQGVITTSGTSYENEPIIKSDGSGQIMQWQPSDGGVDGIYITELVDDGPAYLGIGVATPVKPLHVVGSALVKGKASFVLTGSINVTGTNTAVPGSGTSFTTELSVGDEILVTGETRTIATIDNDTTATVSVAWGSDLDNDTSPECKPAVFTALKSDGTRGFEVDNAGSISTPGGITYGGIIDAAAGSAGAPALIFNGDTNTGLYQTGADALGFSTNGVLRQTISNTGVAVVGAISATTTITGALNGTLGATTPATVVATTVNASGNTTIGAGTAAVTLGGGSSAAASAGYKNLTLSAWSVNAGGTNDYGGDLLLNSGVGTGNGSGQLGSVRIKAGVANATATANGTLLEVGTFSSTGLAVTGALTTTGDVGIGPATAAAELHVSKSADGGNCEIILENTFSTGSSTDETTVFQSRLGGYDSGYIVTGKEGDYSTAALRKSYMAFSTRTATSGISEKMRISSAGTTSLTPAASTYALQITSSNANAIRVDSTATTNVAAIQAHCDTLTTGRLAYFYSNSASTSTRNLVSVINDNAAATGTTCLDIVNDSTGPAIRTTGGSGIVVGSLDIGHGLGGDATNTAVGQNALDASDGNCLGNTAIGNNALTSLATGTSTAGDYNTAVGDGAGYALLDGAHNTACGRASLDASTAGDNNSALGYSALGANCVDDNTAVGHEALLAFTGSNATAVGSGAMLTATWQLAVAHF